MLEQKVKENTKAIVHGTIPPQCLIAMVAKQEHLDIGKLVTKITKAGKKHAKGELDKAVGKLLDKDPYMSAKQLKEEIGNTSADAVKHTASYANKHRTR